MRTHDQPLLALEMMEIALRFPRSQRHDDGGAIPFLDLLRYSYEL